MRTPPSSSIDSSAFSPSPKYAVAASATMVRSPVRMLVPPSKRM